MILDLMVNGLFKVMFPSLVMLLLPEGQFPAMPR